MNMKKTVCIILVVQMILAMFTMPSMAKITEETYYTDVFEGEAVYLIEDPFTLSASNLPDSKARPSGWDIDYRGGTLSKATEGVTIFDISEKESVVMSKKTIAHKNGKITCSPKRISLASMRSIIRLT